MDEVTSAEIKVGKKALGRQAFLELVAAYGDVFGISNEGGFVYIPLDAEHLPEGIVARLLEAAGEGMGIEHGRESDGRTWMFYVLGGGVYGGPLDALNYLELAHEADSATADLEPATLEETQAFLRKVEEVPHDL